MKRMLEKLNHTHFSFEDDPPPAGLRLRKAFNHFVFIELDDAIDILRSPEYPGEPGSNFVKKSSF